MTMQKDLEDNTGKDVLSPEFLRIFGELDKDVDEIKEVLDELLPFRENHYDEFSQEDKIQIDLFLSFTVCSLQWVSLKAQGEDLDDSPLKEQLKRIQASMSKWKEFKDREKRPILNVKAAKRFIKSGLYDPKDTVHTLNKKIKFDDN